MGTGKLHSWSEYLLTKIDRMTINFEPVPWNSKDVLLASLIVVSFVLGYFLLSWLLVYTLGLAEPADYPTVTIFLSEGIMIFAVWLFAARRYNTKWTKLGLRPADRFGTYLAPFLVLFTIMIFTAGYSYVASSYGPEFIKPPAIPEGLLGSGLHRFVMIFALVIWGPFAEEIFFRGFMMTALVPTFGVFGATIVSSLIFAASHMSVGSLVPIFVSGVLFSLLYLRTRSIWPPMTAHALQNFVVVAEMT